MFIIDHGHEEKNDGRSGRDGGSRHGQKLLLVLVTTSDNLGQGVDGLSEDVCRNATGQQDGRQEAEHAAGADGGLARGCHLDKIIWTV